MSEMVKLYSTKNLRIVFGNVVLNYPMLNGISTLNELEKAVEMIKKAVAEGELDENLNAVADVISRRIHKRTK